MLDCLAAIEKIYGHSGMGCAIIGLMLTTDAISHFGSQSALARALRMDQSTIARWQVYPPPIRQIQIERLTKGKLKAEPECWGPKQ